MKVALTGVFCQREYKNRYKGRGHQHPEHICAKILHKMGLVSEK